MGTFGSPFTFTGEQTDANGLVYLRARHYSPAWGVFPSLDPIENLNRYQYVSGNPINRVDPTGLQDDECIQQCVDANQFGSYVNLEFCIQTHCGEGWCSWNDYSELQDLILPIKQAAERWNRIIPSDLITARVLSGGGNCSPTDEASNLDTGLSDDAFAALMAARLHEEGRLDPGRYMYSLALKEKIGDFLARRGSGTVGIANIRLGEGAAAEQLFEGVIPTQTGTTLSFDTSRLGAYVIHWANLSGPKQQFEFLNRNDVSIELLAANIYRGILRAKSDQTTICEPTIFNLGAWTNAGLQENYVRTGSWYNPTNAEENGNRMINHVAMILEGPCDLTLRATPWVDFKYYNEHDVLYVNFTDFWGSLSP